MDYLKIWLTSDKAEQPSCKPYTKKSGGTMQSSAARPQKHWQGNSVMEQVATWEAQNERTV